MRAAGRAGARYRTRVNASTATELFGQLVDTQPDPSPWLVLATGIVALVAVLHRTAWRVLRTVVTIAHEAGHAVVAVVSGRRLQGIRLHSDTSGVTVSKGRPRGTGMVMTAGAGYLTPPVLGVGCALLLSSGHVTALLWLSVALLALMLVVIRNAYGVFAVVVTAATIFAVSWLTPADVQSAFAYGFTWFLLLAGVRPVIELQRKRRRGRTPDSDADQLARLTGIPGLVWVALFLLASVGALLLGLGWLLPELPLDLGAGALRAIDLGAMAH